MPSRINSVACEWRRRKAYKMIAVLRRNCQTHYVLGETSACWFLLSLCFLFFLVALGLVLVMKNWSWGRFCIWISTLRCSLGRFRTWVLLAVVKLIMCVATPGRDKCMLVSPISFTEFELFYYGEVKHSPSLILFLLSFWLLGH